MEVKPEHIIAGLAAADRASLCSFLALYEDGTLPTLLWDMAKDGINWTSERLTGAPEANKTFSDRIAAKSSVINRSGASDGALRVRLWMNLRHGFGLKPELTFARRGIPNITSDLGDAVCKAFSEQVDDEAMENESIFSEEYWSNHANRRLNPFSKEKPKQFGFSEMARLSILKMVAAAADRGELDDETKAELAAKVRAAVAAVDAQTQKRILEELGVEEMTESAAFKLLAAGGGLAGVGIAVEMGGFAAYILAAKASAIIPLVGGKTLVSTLAVVANPWFIVPVILGGGVLLSGNLRSKMCGAFGIAAATILAISAVAKSSHDPTILLDEFARFDRLLPEDAVASYQASQREAQSNDDSFFFELGRIARQAVDWTADQVSSSEYPDLNGYLRRFFELKGQ